MIDSRTSSASRSARSTTRSRRTRSATCWPRAASPAPSGPTGGGSSSSRSTASRENAALVARSRRPRDDPLGLGRSASSGSTRRRPRRMYAGAHAGIDVTEDDALRWITANPAWALGIDASTGTLEVGKAADVWSGRATRSRSTARLSRCTTTGWLVFDRNDPQAPVPDRLQPGHRTAGGRAMNAWRCVRSLRGRPSRSTVRRAQTSRIAGGGPSIPVSGPAIERGTVLCAMGRSCGRQRPRRFRTGAARIDAAGRWVTPGLIHLRTTLGLHLLDSRRPGGDPGGHAAGQVKAAFNVAEGIDPASMTIPVARLEGITSAVAVPPAGSFRARPCYDLAGGRVDEMLVIRSPVAMVIDFGEGGKQSGGGSRAGTLLRLRRVLRDAREYAERQGRFSPGADPAARRDGGGPGGARSRCCGGELPAAS